MSQEQIQVPKGWELESLENLIELIMGQAPPSDSYNHDGVGTTFVKVGEFGEIFPGKKVWTTKPLKLAKVGDVLLCVVGATTGKINLGIVSIRIILRNLDFLLGLFIITHRLKDLCLTFLLKEVIENYSII